MAGILIDEAALASIRAMACCLCGSVGGRTWIHAHHIVKRGMGGGSRYDHTKNLLPVCAAHHETLERLPKSLQFALVAIRECLAGNRVSADEVESIVLDHTTRKGRIG